MKNDEIINIQTNCTLSQYFGVQVMVVFYLRITSKPSYSYCCGFAIANVILFDLLLLLLLQRETLVTAEDGTGRGKRHRSNFSRHGVQACPAPSVIGKSLYSCIVAVSVIVKIVYITVQFFSCSILYGLGCLTHSYCTCVETLDCFCAQYCDGILEG